VADGINYQAITLHKAIIGGDPADPEDIKAYPGAILINVPKFKVHNIALFTNVIKNLGIGLYPMEFASSGGTDWNYANPHHAAPGMKSGIPHSVWVPQLDAETDQPKLDEAGQPKLTKTGGIDATMIDIVKAVVDQGIFMFHVVDGIEMTNYDHTGSDMAVKEPEGMVFAGLDPVATDLICSRYMFSNVTMAEAIKSNIKDSAGGFFPQAVPIPVLEGTNIVTKSGYDCPSLRDFCFERAEQRGLGERKYYVVGFDLVNNMPLLSLQGHLGMDRDGVFDDLVTSTLFYDTFQIPWDLQNMTFAYFDAMDELAGTSLKKEFLDAFDENQNGIVNYEETGKKGIIRSFLVNAGKSVSLMGAEEFGYLKASFGRVNSLKNSDPDMNAEGRDTFKEFMTGSVVAAAFGISKLDMEIPDPFQPEMVCGQGKWPSFQSAKFMMMGMSLYGPEFPVASGAPGLYSSALAYADFTQNGGQYAGEKWSRMPSENVKRYVEDVSNGGKMPLNFTLHVPAGFESLAGNPVPNVEPTNDPARILTVSFDNGKEIWP